MKILEKLGERVKKLSRDYRAITKLMAITLKKAEALDIAGLQQEYHADQERLIEISITDTGFVGLFKVADGKLHFLHREECTDLPDFRCFLDKQTLFDLILNSHSAMDPATGEIYEEEGYSPMDAWSFDRLVVSGENSAGQFLYFTKLWEQLIPLLREEVEPLAG